MIVVNTMVKINVKDKCIPMLTFIHYTTIALIIKLSIYKYLILILNNIGIIYNE